MTLQELSRHVKLLEQLADAEDLLASLEVAALPGAQVFTGLPRAPGISDSVGNMAVEIAAVKEHIRALKTEITRSEVAVAAFIDTIGDPLLLVIFRLRFIRGLTWKETAAAVGGRNTEETVKKTCYRYLAGRKGADGQ